MRLSDLNPAARPMAIFKYQGRTFITATPPLDGSLDHELEGNPSVAEVFKYFGLTPPPGPSFWALVRKWLGITALLCWLGARRGSKTMSRWLAARREQWLADARRKNLFKTHPRNHPLNKE